jgi:hypothetical protein
MNHGHVTAETRLSRQGRHMASLTYDEDITSWLQLLSAIEEAEAGRGTARLTEICLSVYGALAAAQFQITQLRARVHVLAASGPGSHGSPVTATARGYIVSCIPTANGIPPSGV